MIATPNTPAADIVSETLISDHVDAVNAIEAAIEAHKGLYPQPQYYSDVRLYRQATDDHARRRLKLLDVQQELRTIADEIEKLGKSA